jgi:hypothetical protein
VDAMETIAYGAGGALCQMFLFVPTFFASCDKGKQLILKINADQALCPAQCLDVGWCSDSNAWFRASTALQ